MELELGGWLCGKEHHKDNEVEKANARWAQR